MSDLGYFGPDSVTWRVLTDPASGIGGLRSLLLQALHPLAMAGVVEHSSFAIDFWARMQRTGDYVLTVAFGTTEQADAAAERVRRIHPHVRGVDPVTGLAYSAADPELLRWVHVAEFESFLDCVVRAGAPLTPAEIDRYYAEQVSAARLVGLFDVPTTAAQVADYYRDVAPQLRSSSTAEAASARLLFTPLPRPAAWAQPAWTAAATLGLASLPRWARRMYGLPASRVTDLAADAALRGVRAAALRVPATRRLGPMALEGLARAAAAGHQVPGVPLAA